MTKEHLLKYLREPSYLNQVSYQELKTLVAEYPSSLSLRYLLALKSKQENNGDYQRQLEFLGTYSIDRAYLFKIFNQETAEALFSDEIILQEDFLELKELSTLERELSVITNTAKPPIAAVTIKDLPSSPQEIFSENSVNDEFFTLDFEEEIEVDLPNEIISKELVEDNLLEIEELFKDIEIEVQLEEEVSETPPPKAAVTEEKIPISPAITNGTSSLYEEEFTNLELQETLNGGEFPEIPLEVLDTEVDVIHGNQLESPELKASHLPSTLTDHVKEEQEQTPVPIDREELVVNPIPKSSFSTWFEDKKDSSYFNGFDLIGYNSKGLIEELIKKDQENGQEVPLTMEEGIISETLAQLLVMQGHYAEARGMYEQLKLIYPKKCSFFAAEIQRIDNLEAESSLKE